MTLLRLAWFALLLPFAAFAVHMGWHTGGEIMAGHLTTNDFFAHWAAARFTQSHDSVGLYDFAQLHAFQQDLAGGFVKKLPFPYPPVLLFLLAPFGLLSFGWAYLAWMALSLGLYLWASGTRHLAWTVLAPATVLGLAYGQTGLIVAALMVGGLRLLPTRPVAAGVLFGLLLIKPQFAVLLPFALLWARQWRAIGAAAVTVATLLGASIAVQGVDMWRTWLAVIAAHPAYVDGNVTHYGKPNLLGHMLVKGFSAEAAHEAQTVLFLAVSALAIAAYRRPMPLAAAALQACTLAGAPYSILYDLPMATNAANALRDAYPTPWLDAAVATAGMSMPAVMTLTSRFTWTGFACLTALAVLTAYRALSSAAAAPPAVPAP